MRAVLGQEPVHATVDPCCVDLEFVHPRLDGNLVPVCVPTGQFESDVAPLSPDGFSNWSGGLEALNESPSVVVDDLLGAIVALSNVDVL